MNIVKAIFKRQIKELTFKILLDTEKNWDLCCIMIFLLPSPTTPYYMVNSWNWDVPVQSSMHETTLPPPELEASGTTCKGSLDTPLLLGQVLHEIS